MHQGETFLPDFRGLAVTLHAPAAVYRCRKSPGAMFNRCNCVWSLGLASWESATTGAPDHLKPRLPPTHLPRFLVLFISFQSHQPSHVLAYPLASSALLS